MWRALDIDHLWEVDLRDHAHTGRSRGLLGSLREGQGTGQHMTTTEGELHSEQRDLLALSHHYMLPWKPHPAPHYFNECCCVKVVCPIELNDSREVCEGLVTNQELVTAATDNVVTDFGVLTGEGMGEGEGRGGRGKGMQSHTLIYAQ